jgi:hypothetical protein
VVIVGGCKDRAGDSRNEPLGSIGLARGKGHQNAPRWGYIDRYGNAGSSPPVIADGFRDFRPRPLFNLAWLNVCQLGHLHGKLAMLIEQAPHPATTRDAGPSWR